MAPPPHDPVVSPRGRNLIRAAVTELLREPEDLFGAVDAAVASTQSRATLRDPELAEAIRASSRSNLAHWATSNLAAPGSRVPVNPAPEPLALAKLFARRGLEDTSQAAYGAGQNAAWSFWMRAVFALTSDAEELREVLEVSAWSIFAFVDAMVAVLAETIEIERGHALSSTNRRRLGLVRELLDRAPTSVGRAAQELHYPIEIFTHTAVIVWSDRRDAALLEVPERLAESVRPHLRHRPLTVMATPDLVWAWFPAEDLEHDLDLALRRAAEPRRAAVAPDGVTRDGVTRDGVTQDGVRIAIGTPAQAYAGFRSSHADALAARQLMLAGPADLAVAGYRELELLALASADAERATRFSARLLGTLALADPEIADTLSAYLQNRCSPSRTAKAMFTHRNTIIDRIRRAEAHLAVPIDGHEIELGVALELHRWFAGAGGSRLAPPHGEA